MNSPLPPPPESYRSSHKLMGPVLHKLHVSCSHFSDLTLVSLDRPLKPGEKLRFWFHYLACSVCRNFRKQMMALSALVRSAFPVREQVVPDAEFLSKAREKLIDLASRDPE